MKKQSIKDSFESAVLKAESKFSDPLALPRRGVLYFGSTIKYLIQRRWSYIGAKKPQQPRRRKVLT